LLYYLVYGEETRCYIEIEGIYMSTFINYKPSTEKELHGIIEAELDALEEGLSLLNYEFAMETGRADFLCVDSGGRLAVIDVKLHEDENVLFQALRYFSSIDKDRYIIANLYPDKHVDPNDTNFAL
jgi:RecB family endonuclease NucS